MPVPTSITDLSTTAGSNFPQSTDSCGSTLHELPRNVSAIIKKQFVAGSDVAAANGILTLPSDYSSVKITGAGATITGFADCFNGRVIVVRFDGINTLTHSASFDMPTGGNITTESGDVATFINVSSGVWQCVAYEKALLRRDAGEVAFFARSTAPTGWMKANGAAVSRTTYSALFAAIGTTFGVGDGSTTFNLPDMRGEFPRGWDDGRGADAGRSFGSAQSDLVKGHSHYLPTNTSSSTNPSWGISDLSYSWNDINVNVVASGPGSDSFPITAESMATHPTMGSETRPRNIALLACIKY